MDFIAIVAIVVSLVSIIADIISISVTLKYNKETDRPPTR